jgi:hypothetical protein
MRAPLIRPDPNALALRAILRSPATIVTSRDDVSRLLSLVQLLLQVLELLLSDSEMLRPIPQFPRFVNVDTLAVGRTFFF